MKGPLSLPLGVSASWSLPLGVGAWPPLAASRHILTLILSPGSLACRAASSFWPRARAAKRPTSTATAP